MTTTTQRPIAEHLFTSPPAEAQLIGSRCPECGVVTFPRQTACPNCASQDVADALLSRRGTLWTFTTQGFLPKSPYTGPEKEEDFDHYTLGYVELPEGVMIESRLTEDDLGKLEIGMEMELVIVPFREDDDGTEVLSFAFKPAN